MEEKCSIPIKSLPKHIQELILFKTTPICLCRLTQTCKEMNSLISDNKRKLSSRPKLGIDVGIDDIEGPVMIDRIGGSTSFNALLLGQNLSFISIYKLRVRIWDAKSFGVFLKVLEKFPISADFVDCDDMPAIFVVQLSKLCIARNEYTMECTGTDLITLNQSNMRHKFHLAVEAQEDKSFSLVKHFAQVHSMYFTSSLEFLSNLWEMYNSDDLYELKRWFFALCIEGASSPVPFVDKSFVVPPFETIFDVKTATNVRGIRELAHIWKIKLENDKFILICHYFRRKINEKFHDFNLYLNLSEKEVEDEYSNIMEDARWRAYLLM